MSIVNKPPTSIQIEPIFYCNRRCDFCPNCLLKNEKYRNRYMSQDTARKIAYEIAILTDNGNHLRLDMALRGEPLLHPFLYNIIEIFRRQLFKAQISIVTNGYKLTTTRAEGLFSAGLNFIYLDCYLNSYNRWKNKFINAPSKRFIVRDSQDITHWQWRGNKKRVLILGENLIADNKKNRNLVSFCQALPAENCERYGIDISNLPKKKTCVDPFRSMNITWDGQVLLCCRDWTEKRVMFDLSRDEDLAGYWYEDKALNHIRTILQHKDRDFYPCCDCDYNGGVYTGNLPSINKHSDQELKELKRFLSKQLTIYNRR